MTPGRCATCGQTAYLTAHGVEAPWISELLEEGSEPAQVELLSCNTCDLHWFEPRMSAEKADALYRNYREQEYVRTRRKWEPWYLPAWNSSRDPNSDGATEVVAEIEEQISSLPASALRVVADIGGDAGQFFPKAARRKLLVDPSDRDLVPDVERVSSIDQLPREVSLVILGCVLPHLPEPGDFLKEVHQACPGAFVLVQTANDRPRLRARHSTASYRNFLGRLRGNRIAFMISDFATGLCKQFGWRLPRYGVIKQSEHINYFSIASLSRLAEGAGYRVLSSHESTSGGLGGLRLGSLWILLEPIPAQNDAFSERS